MFIVTVTYQVPLEVVDKHLDAHVTYLKEQYSLGNFVASGRQVPRTGGIIISKVKTRNELEEILAQDPFKTNGVATYDIVEFVASMTAEGLESLREQ